MPVPEVSMSTEPVDRTPIGSLSGQLDLSGDWDSPQTNEEIAADFNR